MFGIGPMELVVIVVLALIVLGPERFPEATKTVGRALREFRSATDGITRDLGRDVTTVVSERRELPPQVIEQSPDTAPLAEAEAVPSDAPVAEPTVTAYDEPPTDASQERPAQSL